MPSAGRPLRWELLLELRARGVKFARVTHASGLSATGDPALDAALPLPERFEVPAATAAAAAEARAVGGRIVAVGTSAARALEGAAAQHGGVLVESEGETDLLIGPGYRPCVVDGLLTGTHEPGSSHYQLLGAFADAQTLRRVDAALEANGYRTHEFGDSVLLFRRPCGFPGTRAARRRDGSRRAGSRSGCGLSAAGGSDRPGCRW